GPRIIDLTYEQLQQYQVGSLRPNSRYGSRFPEQVAIEQLKIPKLSDLFDWVSKQDAKHIRFAIETKISPLRPSYTASPEHVVGHLLDLIRQYRLEQRVQVLSFDWRSLQLIQRQSPGMETVYLSTAYPSINNIEPGDGGDSKWTAGFQRRRFASIPHMIKAAGGSHWSAWTVDDTTHMTHMLDMGIDGLVTNRPDRAIQSLKARGQYRTPGAA
ncbi:MAG: glycerophosphodiester phosphodiesterase, partial [Betaproteobacteria bacterium]|nr:glycerophosphodiester phosphodiesterase [Betaproteobacteria bacterium]